MITKLIDRLYNLEEETIAIVLLVAVSAYFVVMMLYALSTVSK